MSDTTNVEPTTKLYRLTSVIDNWPDRGARYNNVRVTWFVVGRDYDPGFDYATLLDRPLPRCSYGQDNVDELFTRHEADQFAEYLRNVHGTDVDITEVSAPINGEYMPIGAIPVGGPRD